MDRRTASLLLAIVAAAFLGGCVNVVVPPADPARPTEVFLLDHGRHASLALPTEGDAVRWTYGDWRWFALDDRSFWNAATLFLGRGSEAGLGRQTIPQVTTLEELLGELRLPMKDSFAVAVPGDRVDELVRRLETFFQQRLDSAVHNPSYGLTFVPHPDAYRLSDNSNHRVAEWLRELGCDVDVDTPLSRWRIERPEANGVDERPSSAAGTAVGDHEEGVAAARPAGGPPHAR